MSTESPRGPNIRELESLRIARAAEPKKPSRIIPAAIVLAILAVAGAAGFFVYQRTIGRPPEVQTAIVTVKQAGQAGTVLTGSGYIITQAQVHRDRHQDSRPDSRRADRGRAARQGRRPAGADRRSRLPGATEAGLRGSRSRGGQPRAEEGARAAPARTLQARRAIEGLARGRGESALGGGGGAQEGPTARSISQSST